MNKQTLLKNINELIVEWYNHDYDHKIFLSIKKLFDDYLIINQKDTDIWLAYALAMNILAEGDDYSLDCLKSILKYDPNNINATLLLVYISAHYSHVDDDLFKQLCNLKTNDNEILSMIEYEKIWYYTSSPMVEKVLKRSIELCDKHVYNFIKLGSLYMHRGNIKEGRDLLKKGLENVKYVYDDQSLDNLLNVDEFLNEHIKGIHLTSVNYRLILKKIDLDFS